MCVRTFEIITLFLRPYLAALVVLFPAMAVASQNCDLTIERRDGGYGPYDYSNAEHRIKRLPVVEKAHFDHVTEKMAIMGGDDKQYFSAFTESTGKRKATGIEGDLSYTLHAFPNHPRALNAISQYQLRGRHSKQFPTADCFFLRAIKYRPDDPTVRSVYGIHFYSRKKYKKALAQFKLAEELMPGDTQNDYNLGLTYFALGDFEKSRQYANKAYQRGWPLKGLKNKLDSRDKK